ncbi:MAG TPA: ABC transporter ATP-binding protein [Burkholderiales bacterium]|nr:ABC transporter ATP-binding protein [Burkholderiales bacterium]
MRKRDVALLVLLNVAATVFESFGVGAFLPLIEIVTRDPAAQEKSRILELTDQVLATLHVPNRLESLILLLLLLLLLRQAFVFLRTAVATIVQQRIKHNARELLFRRYMRAGLEYDDNVSSGQVVNSFIVELQLGTLALMAPIATLNLIVVAAAYLALMFWASIGMTAVSLATLAVAAFLLLRIISITRRAGQELAVSNQQVLGFLVDRIDSLRLIRLSGTEAAETARMGHLSRRIYDINARVGYLSSSLNVLMEPIVVLAGLAILYFGIRSFQMSATDIGFFALVLLRLQPVVKDILKLQQQFVTGWASLDLFQKRLEKMEAARESRTGTAPMPVLVEGIRFDAVEFAYRTQHGSVPSLRGIDLFIPAGKMTALVGPSGAGKSTMIDLLPRLRMPDAGEIVLDSCRLNEIEIEQLRRNIAYVPQAPRVLGSTPLEHIGYGHPSAGQAEIEEAATAAGAHEFITRLPNGYETFLGEDGRLLSGGERQRLDLARALLRKASILILDEPTSNLDAASEANLLDGLMRLRAQGRTTIIVIAHRLTTVMSADQVVVVKAGRVDAVGTHAQLLDRSDWYAEAFSRQSGSSAPEFAVAK